MRTFAKHKHPVPCRAICSLILSMLLTACARKQPEWSKPLQHAREATLAENWETTQKHLLRALENTPESVTVQMNLAVAQWRNGNLNDAVATFNQIVKRDTVPPVAWELYAQLLLEKGNPQGTREILQNLSSPTPRSLTLRAMADMEMQAYERATLALEQALEMNPAYAPAWFHLAIIYRDHMPNQVEAQIAWQHFRQNAGAQHRRADIKAAPRPQPINTMADNTPTATATPPVTAIEPTVPLRQPTAPTPPDTTSMAARIAAAQQAVERGDTDTALISLQEIVQENPSNPDAVWALARFYDIQLELKDRADGLYNTFQQLFPSDPRNRKIPPRAQRQSTTQRTPTADTARQSMLFQQGVEHYSKAEWDAAITAFRRVLAIAPQDAGAAFNLGLTYHKTQDLDAAAAAFRQALENETDMIKSLYMLGLTERDRNNIPEALHLLNRVIRLQPDFAKAHHALGRIYLREGRTDMTVIHFQRILEIDPNSAEAQRAQAWLQQQQNPR